MKKFIVTQDEPTANRLTKMGFVRIMSTLPGFVFLNDEKKKSLFSHFDAKKVVFTNILAM